MDQFKNYINGMYSCSLIDLEDKKWHMKSGIPNKKGWYFISTNTPLSELQKQDLWQETYKKKNGNLANVRNYNLKERSLRYSNDLVEYWNIRYVYSGLASKLRDRAKEHLFPDPGTGCLALSRYPDLFQYKWFFHFVTLERFMEHCECPDMILHLGEQLWREQNGWPILCAE